MADVTGGELLVQSLLGQGVDTLFGIPGVQLDPVFAALHDVQDRLRVVHARHEQGAALMAFGHAKASGRPAVLLVVPGPGFLNAATGLLTAHACNAPVLCLAGQSERAWIGAGLGVLHELDDQLGIAARMTKWARRAERPEDLPVLVAEAFAAMTSGRPRPAYLELPADILRMRLPVPPQPVREEADAAVPPAHEAALASAAELLAQARFPLIVAGGGAGHAGDAVRRLAERLGAPVAMTENGLGVLDSRHPLAFSQLGMHKLWGRADVVLALGTRLFVPVCQWGWDDGLHIIKVDIEEAELRRLPVPLNGIQGDAAAVAECLCELVPEAASGVREQREEALAVLRRDIGEALAPLALPRQVLGVLRRELGEDGILVADVTQLNHACLELFPVHRPRSYLSSGYMGTLGFGPCTAMGAKLARPDLPVVCLVGDGGFMYAAQELAAAVQFGIPVIMLVMNDGAYKNVEMVLNTRYGGRAVATGLHNPDFLKFAESFGVAARRVESPEALGRALRELLKENVPALIDYRLGELPSAFWLRFLPQVREHLPHTPRLV